jgi:mannose-6-phosphate isomerase-like protein (cupin superfamily)
MSDYTKVNVRDVKDMAAEWGIEGLEARFARTSLELERLGVGYEKLSPNFRVPFGHTHAEQEEVYVILSGSGRIKIGDEVIDVGQWDMVRVPAGVIRNPEAGPDGMEVLAIGAPHLDDAELLQGWWSD